MLIHVFQFLHRLHIPNSETKTEENVGVIRELTIMETTTLTVELTTCVQVTKATVSNQVKKNTANKLTTIEIETKFSLIYNSSHL